MAEEISTGVDMHIQQAKCMVSSNYGCANIQI